MATSRQVRIFVSIDGERVGAEGLLVTGDIDGEGDVASYALWNGRLSAASAAPALIGGCDATRRQAFAVATDGAVPVSLGLWGQADFSWNGGAPPDFVELDDYPDGVFREADVEDILVYSMLLMTTKLESQQPLSVGGDWVFVDGELEAEAPVYPGTS